MLSLPVAACSERHTGYREADGFELPLWGAPRIHGELLKLSQATVARYLPWHHDVGSVVFLQLGVVFAVLLAFVFSEAWGEYNEAAQSIDLEVSAMHGVGMIAVTLGPAQANGRHQRQLFALFSAKEVFSRSCDFLAARGASV